LNNSKGNDSMGWARQSRGRDQDTEIDRFIIQGYDHLDKGDHDTACQSWVRVWDHFLLRLSPGMTSCEQTLPVYDGSFFLSNWLSDYCAAMHSVALNDEAMARTGASFCQQVLLQFPDEKVNLLANFRASLGEFLFLAGKTAEGEKELTALIADLPGQAIGYAYLADMLGDAKFNIGQESPIDLQRAIDLLEKGLAYPVEDPADFDLEKKLNMFRDNSGQ